MKPILYSKTSGCGGCIAAKRDLKSRGIDYELRSAEEYQDELAAMGVMKAPVLVVGETWYQGYRPDIIATL